MSEHKPVRILGGSQPFQGEPTILDQRTKQPPQPVDVRVHEDSVVSSDEIRRDPPKPGEPEVRVRNAEVNQREFRKTLESEEG